jgi:hypothetical protein
MATSIEFKKIVTDLKNAGICGTVILQENGRVGIAIGNDWNDDDLVGLIAHLGCDDILYDLEGPFISIVEQVSL